VPGVHLDGETGPFVYKEYKKGVVAGREIAVRSGLRTLIRARLGWSKRERAAVDRRCAWPLAVVTEGNGATGLLMRRLPEQYFRQIRFSTGAEKVAEMKLQLFLQHDAEVRARGLPPLDDTGRLHLYGRVLGHLATLHGLGVVVGDISDSNVMVAVNARDQTAHLPMFIDTDSARLRSSVAPLTQPNTPAWDAPEHLALAARLTELKRSRAPQREIERLAARQRVQTAESDVFKAGLLGLRLMATAQDQRVLRASPQARDRWRGLIGASRCRALEAALAVDPQDRPTMAELSSALRKG
jgi:serine/threonine protein kinase